MLQTSVEIFSFFSLISLSIYIEKLTEKYPIDGRIKMSKRHQKYRMLATCPILIMQKFSRSAVN